MPFAWRGADDLSNCHMTSTDDQSLSKNLRPVRFLLSLFVLAGLTGVLYRLQMVGTIRSDLDLTNIRHAHSHLMFFSWAAAGPMWFIIRALQRRKPGIGRMGYRLLYLMLSLALLAWPFFLGWGYQPVSLGSLHLPLSVMVAGLIMLVWYTFVGWYVWQRRRLSTDNTLLLFDGALLLLVLCTLGAWGISMVEMTGIQSLPLTKGLTHFFLTVFTEGWCVLAALGIWLDMAAPDQAAPEKAMSRGVALMVFSAPLIFPFGLPAKLLSPALLWTARLGALLNVSGLILILKTQLPRFEKKWSRSIWLLLVSLLVFKAAMLSFAAAGTEWFWVGKHGFRIFYLHITLLGFLSLVLMTAGHKEWQYPSYALKLFAATVLLVLATLIPLTPIWPLTPSGMWTYQAAAIAALGPVLAMLVVLWRLGKNRGVAEVAER